jgi:FlaA1/EpsC-like NDP-sugar epimerase
MAEPGEAAIYTSAVTPELASMDWHRFLGRPALPAPAIQALGALCEERILVTGAGGSIGSALARRLAALEPSELVLLDASENRLAALQGTLTLAPFRSVLGNVGNAYLLHELFAKSMPTIVFHAAAYKHVPLLEGQPFAAVENNVLATDTLASIAAEAGARIILLSTDKAVEPVSMMGGTKRVAEQIVRSVRGTVVRLGNVLGSSGSVAEVFAGELAKGEPMTVTDPLARRYFLTIEEAVNLLIAASAEQAPEDLLAPALAAQQSITDLASFMAQELHPGRRVSIEFTRPRPGDKECEKLWSACESASPTDGRGLMMIASPRIESSVLRKEISGLRAAVNASDLPALLAGMQHLVPDYAPSATVLTLSARSAEPILS